MAQAVDTWDWDEPVERRPGDFARSRSGTPYVANKDGRLVKSGKRKGLVVMEPHGRPSGFGDQVEDTWGLAKHGERQVPLGLGIDYLSACAVMEQPKLAVACAALAGLDRDSAEFRTAADAIVAETKRIAKTDLAADQGTQSHALTEDHDNEVDPIARFERGEELGLDVAVQRSIVDAWRDMVARYDLEILATEFRMVHDRYHLAGTGDRIVRLRRELRFTLASGEIVTLPAGTVLVLDIKTGKLRLSRRGEPIYWQSYAVQIHVYATGVAYDPDTDTRSPYPWPVDAHWALIAWLPVGEAIAGRPTCELILVDIAAGGEAAEHCLWAKGWEKRSDVFSVANISEAADTSDEQPPEEPPIAADPVASVSGADPASALDAAPGEPVSPRVPTNAELHARLRRHPDIDEGAVDGDLDALFARMAEHFLTLPNPAKAWAAELQVQAQQHGCGFHARERHTLRRFEIIRGLIVLAVSELDDDELVRMLVHHVTGDDAALFPVITPGHALGALDATEARAFALACDQLAADQIVLTFTDGGTPRFVTRRAA